MIALQKGDLLALHFKLWFFSSIFSQIRLK